ncbi:hypothetical protein C5167_017268 [Papaver somniferum]|uniref:Flap endonuclease 1 n=1 Tax=Papaver somniferum TaxID=3469 RepID=A0A4Y7IIY3_PAPSO|nr:hypothetical protein C5167_017268 [Papaver somniferum]
MGIKGLTKLLANNAPKSMKQEKLESYTGREIAIDASLSIYQFLIVVGRNGMGTLTNEAGEVTSHLHGLFSRTIRLLEAGLKPVYVFDGKPPDLKRQELAKRSLKRLDATEDLAAAIESGDKEDIEKFSKRTVKVTKQHNDDCKVLLQLMGIPVVQAASEAEAECAALCKSGKVYAVSSEDMDTLTFGAPRFLRHLMGPTTKVPVVEYDIEKILTELNLTMDQFVDLCILCGCDYCPSIRGVGEKTALKLIRQHGSIESILENINRQRYHIPENWMYQEARHLFKEPLFSSGDQQSDITWTGPDEEGLINFLVEENGFNHYRVTKAIQKIEASSKKSSQIRSTSSKQVVSTSFLERKETKCVLGAFDLPVKPKVFSHGHLKPTNYGYEIDELGAAILQKFLPQYIKLNSPAKLSGDGKHRRNVETETMKKSLV